MLVQNGDENVLRISDLLEIISNHSISCCPSMYYQPGMRLLLYFILETGLLSDLKVVSPRKDQIFVIIHLVATIILSDDFDYSATFRSTIERERERERDYLLSHQSTIARLTAKAYYSFKVVTGRVRR